MKEKETIKIKLDPWQKNFLETKGNKILCTGRQCGKSQICAQDAGEYAIHSKDKLIMMIAPTERQAFNLFDKTLQYIDDNNRKLIKKGRDRPTKTKIELINGTTIMCLPCGFDAHGIRGYTINRLYIDEASRVPDEVFFSLTPSLLVTGGDIVLLSTPFGRKGFFFDMYKSENFAKFYANSEDVVRNREICATWTEVQRDKAISYLEDEKKRMTRLQYQQEFVAEFVEDLMQFFPDELIRKCQAEHKRPSAIPKDHIYFLGVDIGGRGGDESVLTMIDRTERQRLKQVECIIALNEMTTDTERLIIHEDNIYKFKRIYIDDGGMGVGVFDHLLETQSTKRKVVAINNARRALDKDEDRKKKLLKEDLYNNLLCLMERGEIQLLDDPEVFQSLKSVQFEYTENKEMKIFGNYTHIAEALIRAAWCVKDKSLNVCIY